MKNVSTYYIASIHIYVASVGHHLIEGCSPISQVQMQQLGSVWSDEATFALHKPVCMLFRSFFCVFKLRDEHETFSALVVLVEA